MLTYALETPQTSKVCSAQDAKPSHDYFCMECKQAIRKRQGQKQAHFYHYQGSLCKWAAVSWPHLKTQFELAKLFQGHIEQRFPSIGRIGDVYVSSKSLVIEVQYSPIKMEEVIKRVLDYQSIGLCVLWILQKDHPLAGEYGPGGALFGFPHYFCDMDADFLALFDMIEDQICPLPSLPKIRQTSLLQRLSLKLEKLPKEPLTHFLWQRHRLWNCGLTGDFLDHLL